MSDSLTLEATGDDRDRLASLLDLCACQSVTGMVTSGNVLKIVREYDPTKPRKMAFPPSLMVDAIMDWIAPEGHGNGAEFPDEPDIDGSCERGYRLVSGDWHDDIEIHPHWMIYHK